MHVSRCSTIVYQHVFVLRYFVIAMVVFIIPVLYHRTPTICFWTLFVVQVHTGSRCLPKTSLVMDIHNDLAEVPEKKAGSHFCFAIGLEGVGPYIFVSFSFFLLGSAEDIHGDASTGNVAWTPPQAMSNHWVRIGDQEIQKCAAPEPG